MVFLFVCARVFYVSVVYVRVCVRNDSFFDDQNV